MNNVGSIFPVCNYDTSGYFTVVDGKVKQVYDTTSNGTLIPVNFTQHDDNTISLTFEPKGQLYYRYKKNK